MSSCQLNVWAYFLDVSVFFGLFGAIELGETQNFPAFWVSRCLLVLELSWSTVLLIYTVQKISNMKLTSRAYSLAHVRESPCHCATIPGPFSHLCVLACCCDFLFLLFTLFLQSDEVSLEHGTVSSLDASLAISAVSWTWP